MERGYSIGTSRSRINNIKEWNVHPHVKDQIQDTGFLNFLDLKFTVKIPLQMIQALLKIYEIKTQCFNINGRLISITLEDISYITGLPINGKPVLGIELDQNDYCMRYLGKEDPKKKKSGTVSLEWLRTEFENIVGPATPEHVRAYLLYVIGSAIVPAGSAHGVPSMYLPLLEDISQVKTFAWGAALLSHLLCELNKAKDKNTLKSPPHGCLFPLVVFAVERIPKLLGYILNDTEVLLPQRLPLMVPWSHLLHKFLSNTRHTKKTNEYLEFFTSLTETHDIKWRPYSRLAFTPEHIILGHSQTILFCFNYAAFQNPIPCCKQFGIENVEIVNDGLVCQELKVVMQDRKGQKGERGRDWRIKYANYLKMWDDRHKRIIQGSPYNEEPPSNDISLMPLPFQRRRKGYLAWRAKRSKEGSGGGVA